MDSRAAKIVLAAFLAISFITPFFRLSVAMPKKGKNDGVTFRPATLAQIVTTEPGDSTTLRVSEIGH